MQTDQLMQCIVVAKNYFANIYCTARAEQRVEAKMNSTLVNMDMLADPEILKRCRKMLQTDGVMVLPGFATAEGLRLLREEILSAPFNVATRNFTAWQDQGNASC